MARKNPTHISKEQWQVILDQWQSSGISVRQFCQDKSIPVSNFYNWRKRLIKNALNIGIWPENAVNPSTYKTVFIPCGYICHYTTGTYLM